MANKNINNLATKDDIDDIKDDALILVMGILRKGKWPTKEEIESLRFLEQELSV